LFNVPRILRERTTKMSDDICVIREPESLALRHELSVEEVVARVQKVHAIMRQAMVLDHHYGKVPGTTKDVLLKPGAELLCLTFRLDPQYAISREREDGHLTVLSTCTLWHIPTGQRCGSGMGSCSTRESKYAYRQAKRACPKCGAEQINKSKFPPRGAPKETEPGWYCYAKVGGCGQEFAAEDPAITGQITGRVANEDLADTENTVLKMANKRSLVAAVLNVTAASDIFTQDLEDSAHEGMTPTTSAGGVIERRPESADSGSAAAPRASETSKQEAARVFPQEDELRGVLVAYIKTLAEEKKIPAKDRQLLSQSVLAGATLDTADIAALQDLETAVINWRAK